MADKTVITLGDGKVFVIKAEHLSSKNIYVQGATLNGQPYFKSYITHKDIVGGGELLLMMGNYPSDSWGTGDANLPGR
jgi:putative alpha-1,2-mannosidase